MGDKDNYPLNNGLPTKQWSINLIVEEDPRSSPMAILLVHSLKLMEAHIAVRNPVLTKYPRSLKTSPSRC